MMHNFGEFPESFQVRQNIFQQKSLLVIQNISFSLSDFIKNVAKVHAVVNNDRGVTSDVQSCSISKVNGSAKDMSGTISWEPLNLLR